MSPPLTHCSYFINESTMKHTDAFTKCGTGRPRDKAVLFYSLRRNQKIHYRNVTSAISSKLIPGTSPDLNRELIQVDNNIIMPSNSPTRETDNITYVPLPGNFLQRAHYLLSISYISSQDRIILTKIPTFVQGHREEQNAKTLKFSNPLRSCQNKEKEIKRNGQEADCQSKWKIKTTNRNSISALSAKFLRFFSSRCTFSKL